jgi:DNA mismatch endonuclease, patch repair protein
MTDVHTPEQRSRNMAAIRGKNTKPELRVRSILHNAGYRFRLHKKDLAGRPDIVVPKYHVAIFVHGCFWHSHTCRFGNVKPATRPEFWAEKRDVTVQRDQKKTDTLREQGWKVIVVWECEVDDGEGLLRAMKKYSLS